MRILTFFIAWFGLVNGEKLLLTQTFWRHGLRTPTNTYANDPYTETFFGVPDGELLPKGMEQQFIRGQQLRKLYTEDQISAKYSRYDTYVRSGDFPRCSQSALANLAGFYDGSPTFPTGVANWPSYWTPIPIHTVPHDEDYIIEAFEICAKLLKLQNDRMQRNEFHDFIASNWRLLHIINVNSGNPEDYSYMALAGMFTNLSIEGIIAFCKTENTTSPCPANECGIFRKLSGCGSDLCSLFDFKKFMQPFIANDVKVCDVRP